MMRSLKKFFTIAVLMSAVLFILGAAQAATLTLPADTKVIEEKAFYGDTSLDEVVLPDQIKRIESKAFSKSSVKTVFLPDTLEFIADDAFDSGADIKMTANPGTKAYNWAVDHGFIKETDIVIPPNAGDFKYGNLENGTCEITKYIGNSKNDIVIPKWNPKGIMVTGIGSGAFEDRDDLTGTLTIPDSVTYIGRYAFSGCSHLSGSLTIPQSVKSIDDYAFYNCSGFDGNLIISDGVKVIGHNAFRNCSGFTGDLIIPSSITTVGYNAFASCGGFDGRLIISEGVTSLGGYAFGECNGFIGDIILPNSIVAIENSLFSGCSGFTGRLIIPESVTSIGDYAFFKCSNLSGDLIIPDGVTKIEDNAFGYCAGFTGSLMIGEGVVSIGEYAFYECNGFTGSLKISDSVLDIGNQAFYGCSGFDKNIEFGDSITTIGKQAFMNCGFTGRLILPDTITNIGACAFQNCSFTGELKLPKNLTTIEEQVFHCCRGFTGNLIIPSGVTFIGKSAFSYCSGFQGSLSIPESVTTIGESAFSNCWEFTGSLTIPNSVTTIGNYAFNNCSRFTGSLTIPNSVTTIGKSAFDSCSGFTGSLTIPNSVTTIGEYAFAGCSGFTGTLTIPNSVTSIGTGAFGVFYINFKKIAVQVKKSDGTTTEEFRTAVYCPVDSHAWSWAESQPSFEPVEWDGNPSTLPEESQLTGAFTDDSITLTIGEPNKTPAGYVKSIGKDIYRVSITVAGYEMDDPVNNRYATDVFIDHHTKEVNLTDWAAFYLDTTRAPFNVPGEYTIKLWANTSDADASSNPLDSKKVRVIEKSSSTISGVVCIGNKPVESVYIVAQDDESGVVISTTLTDSNGRWALNLANGRKYSLGYGLAGFRYSTGVTSVDLSEDIDVGTIALEASSVEDGIISFTMSEETVLVGTSVHFDVTCSFTNVIRLVVDDVPYEYITLEKGNGFDRVFSMAGERNIQFIGLDSDGISHISNKKVLNVTVYDEKNPELDKPNIEPLGDQYKNKDFQITWEEVKNATTYTIYVYSPYGLVWQGTKYANSGEVSTKNSIIVPGKCLIFSGNYKVEVIASGIGWSQATGTTSFTVYDCEEEFQIALTDFVEKIHIGDQITIEIKSSYDLKNSSYILECNRPDDVKIDANRVTFMASGEYQLFGTLTIGNKSYVSDPIIVKVESEEISLVAETIENKIRKTYEDYFWTPVGTEIPLRLTTNFAVSSVKVSKNGIDCSNELIGVNNKEYKLLIAPSVADVMDEYIFEVTDIGGKKYESECIQVYVMKITEMKDELYLLKPGTPLYSTPVKRSLNVPNDFAPVNAVSYKDNDGNYKFKDLILIDYNGTEYFVEKENCLNPDQVLEATGISSIESSFEENIVYTNQELIFSITTDFAIKELYAQVHYVPANDYNKGSQERIIWLPDEKCIPVQDADNKYIFKMKPKECGQYTIVFQVVTLNGNKLRTHGIGKNLYSIQKEDDKIVFENVFETYYLYDDPRLIVPSEDRLDYTTSLHLLGEAGNDVKYVKYLDVDNTYTYGFISAGIIGKFNDAEKTAHIIVSHGVSGITTGATAMSSSMAVGDILADAGARVQTYPDVNTKDFVDIINNIDSEADFNDITYIFLFAHGNSHEPRDSVMKPENVVVENTGSYSLEGIFGTGYEMSNLLNRICQIPGEKILILEMCHSGEMVNIAKRFEKKGLIDPRKVKIVCSSLASLNTPFGATKIDTTLFGSNTPDIKLMQRALEEGDSDNNGEISLNEYYWYRKNIGDNMSLSDEIKYGGKNYIVVYGDDGYLFKAK